MGFPLFITTNSRFSISLIEQIAPSIDLNTIKQRYQCPVLLRKHVSYVCTPFMIYLKYLLIHLSPFTFHTGWVQWLMCVPRLCGFWFIFSYATVPEFFSPKRLSFLMWMPRCGPSPFPCPSSVAGQVAPFSGKEVAASLGQTVLSFSTLICSLPWTMKWTAKYCQ